MTWAPGDRAICVRGDWRRPTDVPAITIPRLGAVYEVAAVESCSCCATLFLHLVELPGYAFQAVGFRRIAPLTEEERRQAEEDLPVPQIPVAA